MEFDFFDFKVIGLYSIESSEISDELKKIIKKNLKKNGNYLIKIYAWNMEKRLNNL